MGWTRRCSSIIEIREGVECKGKDKEKVLKLFNCTAERILEIIYMHCRMSEYSMLLNTFPASLHFDAQQRMMGVTITTLPHLFWVTSYPLRFLEI